MADTQGKGYRPLEPLEDLKEGCVDPEQIASIYDKWAENFEKDALEVGAMGQVVAPKILGDFLSDNKNARILDLAAGTGMAGQILFDEGFHNLDALDVSEKMLEQAKKRGIFKNFIKAYMGKDRTPDIDDDTYDGIVCTHAFTMGHISSDALVELVRMTKPGGFICFTVRKDVYVDAKYGFQETHAQLLRANKWDLALIKKFVYHENYDEFHRDAYVCVFQVV